MRWEGVRVFGDLRQGCLYGRAAIVSIYLPRVSFWRSAITAFGLFDFFYQEGLLMSWIDKPELKWVIGLGVKSCASR